MSGAVLSAGQAAAVLFGVFFALIVLRIPVAFALGLACLPILLIEPRLSIMMLAQETFNAYNSFILLAVPFFLLTANLMSVGGITDRLVELSRALVGHWPGSLAQINVVLSVFFAGISGSSTADAASQSKIFIDAQTREGYDLSFSIAITAVSAVLAVIIPPSILMIVWGGLISDVDRRDVSGRHRAGPVDRRRADGHRACLCGAARLSDLSEIKLGGDALRGLALAAGADDAVHHRRRHPARLVHGDRVRLRRRALFDRAVEHRLPGNRREGALQGAARYRAACRGRAVLRRHGERVRLAARLLPDSARASGQRVDLGHGADRGRLLHCVLFSRRRLFPRRHPGDHHRRHRARTAGALGRSASGAVRHHLDRVAGVRTGDAALRSVPDDRVLDRRRAAALRAEGHDDHARADADRAGRASSSGRACRSSCRA